MERACPVGALVGREDQGVGAVVSHELKVRPHFIDDGGGQGDRPGARPALRPGEVHRCRGTMAPAMA
jgi:hypothetical protein